MSIMDQLMQFVTWITCRKTNIQVDNSSEVKEEISLAESIANKPTPELPDTPTVQNFLLVWVDEHIDQECWNTITELREVVNTVKTFTNIDECVRFITDVKEEKIFIISSATLSNTIIPIVHDMPQVSSIYVIRGNEMVHEQWPKIKSVFTDTTRIYEELKKAAQECDQNSVTVNFLTTDSEISTENLNKLQHSFMYTQILKEILLTIDFEKEHLAEFLTYCRDQLVGNTIGLKKIDRLEQEYIADVSIWWYTYDYFIYSIINRTLRAMEVNLIIKMGFFVRDLHRQIARLHAEQYPGKDNSSLLPVFRGQGLSSIDFDQLQKTQNGLISFNNFLSTSYDRSVSLAYAESNRDDPNLIGVLFQITIDLSTSSTPFANIRNASAFQDEEEVLFSMHSIFRIGPIKSLGDNNRLWQVDLTLTSDNDPQLNALTECMREETFPEQKGWYRLGNLLGKLNQFDKAHEVFDIMLGQTSDTREKGNIYQMLGIVHRNQGDYAQSIAVYQKSLEIYQEILPENDLDLSAAYNNIGLVYDQMGEPAKALSFYQKALEIHRNILPSNHLHLAHSYDSIGAVYNNMGEYSKALSYQERALKIYEDILPVNHPNLADSYNNVGMVYMKMGESSTTLSYYEKALEISEKTLSANHPDLAISYNNIGLLHNEMGEYSKALFYYQKAIEINQKSLPENHPNLASCYNNLGEVSDNMNEHAKALSYYEKALEIYQKTLPENHPNLACCYNNIGSVFYNMSDCAKALSFFEKNLQILEVSLPEDHPDLACTYNNIASIYSEMNEHSKAIFYYEKSLEICQKTLPENHPHMAISHNNIGQMYDETGEYSKALSFYQRAADIAQHSLPFNHPDLQRYTENLEILKTKL